MDTERAENKPDNNASRGYQPGNIWYRLFRNLIFTPIVKWFWKVEVIGAENIPANGCVIAANHIDAGDTIALPAALKPAMIFPAKKELFEGKTWAERSSHGSSSSSGRCPSIDPAERHPLAAWRKSSRNSPQATPSASFLRAPGAPTGVSTRATPELPEWRSR